MPYHSALRPASATALLASWLACAGHVDGRTDGPGMDSLAAARGAPPPVAQQVPATREPRHAGVAELPRYSVEIPPLRTTGRTIEVPAGGNLQRAIDEARGGDEIVLSPEAEYTGPFTLRKKEGSGWIVIRGGAPAAALPAEGERVTPAHAARLPRLVTRRRDASVIYTEPGARQYRLVGLEVTADSSLPALNALVRLGDGSDQGEGTPSHLILDRMYIHGHTRLSLQRCVMMNSAWSAVVNSYLSECHAAGFDSQAIIGWNGPGPFRIENNYLEGAGEVVMFGGANPRTQGLVPADIEVRRNHFNKPVAWRQTRWSIKNLFELKFARRVLVEGNVFEGNWRHAQTGFAILLKSSGGIPWAVTEDVTIRYNRIRNVGGGFVLNAQEAQSREITSRIRIENNLLYDVNTAQFPGAGSLIQGGGGVRQLEVEHNTLVSSGQVAALLMLNRAPAFHSFVFRYNVASLGRAGVKGSGTGTGAPSLRRYAPDAVFTGNLLIGSTGAIPPGNTTVRSLDEVGFVRGDYRLASRRLAASGKSLGADVAAIDSATAGVVQR